jgi:hypothetical protein
MNTVTRVPPVEPGTRRGRFSAAPEVPAMAAAGVSSVEAYIPLGLPGPAGMPGDMFRF